MKPPVKSISVLLAAAIVAAIAGCGVYSFTSGRKPIVESIGVPLFTNETNEYGLAEALTEGIAGGLVEENIIKVLDPSRAEGILRGTVLTYRRSAYTFDAAENVQEYLVEITIKAELVRAADETAIWTAPSIRGWGEYSATDETETDGQRRAIDKLTQEIVDRTVKGW